MKLFRRGHVIPKALHANMFLVRRAKDVMDTDIMVLPAEMSFDAFRRTPEHHGRMRHVLVKEGKHLVGAVRINTGIRQGLEGTYTGVKLGEVAPRNFTIVREDDVVFDVIDRMWRKKADMALVVRTRGVSRPGDVLGVITKEHVADSVASSISVYPG